MRPINPTETTEPIKRSTPSRQGEYARIATLLPTAIEKLGLLLESHNQAIQLGAVNKILDKCLPDIKSVEVSGTEGKDLEVKINIVHEREARKEE